MEEKSRIRPIVGTLVGILLLAVVSIKFFGSKKLISPIPEESAITIIFITPTPDVGMGATYVAPTRTLPSMTPTRTLPSATPTTRVLPTKPLVAVATKSATPSGTRTPTPSVKTTLTPSSSPTP